MVSLLSNGGLADLVQRSGKGVPSFIIINYKAPTVTHVSNKLPSLEEHSSLHQITVLQQHVDKYVTLLVVTCGLLR